MQGIAAVGMTMLCQSCKEEYGREEAGTCKECYEEASETEEELKREIDELKSKLSFLKFDSPNSYSSTDLTLSAADDPSAAALPAHRVVLVSRSPVFRAMLENEMEESRSGVIKIHDVSYDVLRAFLHYLYTAEVLLDEQRVFDLLNLAEQYQVKHLKSFCEKFLTSKVNNENAITSYAFAHKHNCKQLLEAALSLIIDNMGTLTVQDEYKELVEKDPRLIVEIYEAYLTRQVNSAS